MILHSNVNESNGNKLNINDLCKQIKVMRPGAVLQFIAKQFGMSSTEFVAKHALSIAKMAIKNGWVKTKDIGASITDFAKKNKEDVTGIDFSKAEIDPSTTMFKCLFDNVGDKLSTFMKDLENELKDESKEIEKADKQLHADVKKAGVDMDEQEVDDNGLAVASVIDNKKNKGKSGKDLKKKIESAIKKDKRAKEIQNISKELKKTSSKIKVDKKYEKISDEELAKLDDKINKKIRNRSEASKKNDAFRNKIKNAILKGVSEDFKNSVKTAYVSTDKLKKSIASNMKPGLAVEQIKEPRAVCISIQCDKEDFGNVLKEADDSAKIIDVTNGSKDEGIQKAIDYIKKVLQDKIGKDKLGKKIYAYLKNSDKNLLLYVFAGVKQDKLDESLLNEETLTGDSPIEDIMSSIKIDGNKISGFSGGMVLTSLMNSLKVDDANDLIKTLGGQRGVENILKQFLIANDAKGTDKAVDMLLNTFKNDEYKKLIYSEFISKMIPDAKEALVKHGITATGYLGGLIDDISIFDNLVENPSNKEIAKEVASEIKDKAVEVVDKYHYVGPARVNLGELKDKLGISSKKIYGILGGSVVQRNLRVKGLELDLEAFLSRYDKDPDKAIKMLLAGKKGVKADLIAELAAKLKPEAAEKFKELGIDIDGKIGSVAAKAANAADTALTTADTTSDAMNSIPLFNYSDINNEIKELNNIFSDGKIDADEMQKLTQVGDKLKSFSKWAAEHQDIDDPSVRERITQIKVLCSHYRGILADNKDVLDSAAAAASDARTGATEATRAASKEMANDEEVKKAASSWKEKLGLDKAFTALGWARLAAKTTGIIINNGKAVVDALGAAAVKFKEDSNVIAQMNFLLTNGEGNDAKFQDSKFSVRFSTNDMKWHATCLDDRKMKFDEDELIKKALDSEEGKKFKAACLKKWTRIFKPKDETRQVIPYIMKNFEKIGLKASESNVNKIVDTVHKMEDNFSIIEKEFK